MIKYEIVVNGLSFVSERFALLKDETLNQQGYRKCVVKNFLIFYKIFEEENIVRVYRILYARRNWKFLL